MVIVEPFLDKYHIVEAYSIYSIGIRVKKDEAYTAYFNRNYFV